MRQNQRIKNDGKSMMSFWIECSGRPLWGCDLDAETYVRWASKEAAGGKVIQTEQLLQKCREEQRLGLWESSKKASAAVSRASEAGRRDEGNDVLVCLATVRTWSPMLKNREPLALLSLPGRQALSGHFLRDSFFLADLPSCQGLAPAYLFPPC